MELICGTYVLDHMAMIADKEDRSALGQIDLHSDQTVRVSWEVVQSDALAEVEAALVEGLPVPNRCMSVIYNESRVLSLQPFQER